MEWLPNRVRQSIAALVAAVFLAGAPFSAWASMTHVRSAELPRPCHDALALSGGQGSHVAAGKTAGPAMPTAAATCCNVIMPALLPPGRLAASERGSRRMPKAASDAPLADTEPRGLERPPRIGLI